MATFILPQSGSGNKNMKCRITFTAGGGSITVTNLEGCRVDGYTTMDDNNGNNIVFVNIGGITQSFVPNTGKYNKISFPANSAWASWGMTPITQGGLNGVVSVIITFQSNTSNIANSRFEATIDAGYPIYTPTLSNINVYNVGDSYASASFSVTNNGNQDPYSPYIELSLSNFGAATQTLYDRNVTFTGLNANRQYFVRGSDANDGGRSYTNVGSFVTPFYTPGLPGASFLSLSQSEATIDSYLKITWTASTPGSTPIAGYRIKLYKNNVEIKVIDTENTNITYTFSETLGQLGYNPGDTIKVGMYSYCRDWAGTQFFSGGGTSSSEVFSSNTIKVVSDKFVYASINGGTFEKYKAYISVNGTDFVEIKKEKFKVIN